ncbi:MAG TPA: hypothetical protein PLV92_19855, partial [Pirellulaceae bacterium]|nr:hypothetical protein [Pirellulaceae bacterium]
MTPEAVAAVAVATVAARKKSRRVAPCSPCVALLCGTSGDGAASEEIETFKSTAFLSTKFMVNRGGKIEGEKSRGRHPACLRGVG